MNPPRNILLAIGAFLLSLRAASAQGTFTVTFDGPPVRRPGASVTVGEYYEGSVWFTGIPGTDGFTRTWSGDPRYPDNGSLEHFHKSYSVTGV